MKMHSCARPAAAGPNQFAHLRRVRSGLGRNLPMHPQTHTQSRPGSVPTRKDQSFLGELDEVLNSNYANRSFDLSRMAAAMGISERQLQRKLKALTGHTPSDHLRAYRLQKSLEQLREGNPISEVAKAVGFSSQSYFASCFKAQFGTTPKQFQQGWL